jgi:hypothetical protein
MELSLIQGRFRRQDAIDILTRMVHVKISFHESRIQGSSNEDDIKFRESKIKQLQRELYDCVQQIRKNESDWIELSAAVRL